MFKLLSFMASSKSDSIFVFWLLFFLIFVLCWSNKMEAQLIFRVLKLVFYVSKVSLDSFTITCSRHHIDCIIVTQSSEVFASLSDCGCFCQAKSADKSAFKQSLSEVDQICSAIIGPTVHIIEKFKMLTGILAECFVYCFNFLLMSMLFFFFLFQLCGNFSSGFGAELQVNFISNRNIFNQLHVVKLCIHSNTLGNSTNWSSKLCLSSLCT